MKREIPLFPAEAEGFSALQNQREELVKHQRVLQERADAAFAGVMERAGVKAARGLGIRWEPSPVFVVEVDDPPAAEPPQPPTAVAPAGPRASPGPRRIPKSRAEMTNA